VWAGTKLKFKPGIVMGGRNLVHDCGLTRSIGYFLEPLIVLGLFAKKPLSIKLTGNSLIVNLAFICFIYLFCICFLFKIACAV
jgi:RNA 3'-terminal phosphate cyclase